MARKGTFGIVMLVSCALAATAWADIYSVGHVENGGSPRSWLETWNVNFTPPRVAIGDVGPTHGAWHSPHAAAAVGDLFAGNPGDEVLLIGDDGWGVTLKKDASEPRLGGALAFSRNTINHVAGSGPQLVAIADVRPTPGNEVITIANDGAMEIWDFDEAAGVTNRGQLTVLWAGTSAGHRPKDTGKLFDGYTPTNPAFDGAALGEFNAGNEGLEVALLRADGLVEIWDMDQTGSWPATQPDRLAIFGVTGGLFHSPFDHFFSGDLDPTNAGDEIGLIGTDGWYIIVDPETGSRISAPANAYSTSGHDPFLAVTADAVPEPATLTVLALGGLAVLRRRR